MNEIQINCNHKFRFIKEKYKQKAFIEDSNIYIFYCVRCLLIKEVFHE